jgi:putative glutamine amidotransferase
MKPIIGIIGRNDLSYLNKTTTCVFDNYRKAIINFGGIPILILPPQQINYYDELPKNIDNLTNDEKEMLIRQIKLCNGIILPGGVKRFEYDDFICDYCNKENIPLLGICMGMQVMCNYDNDNINIKIENHYEDIDYKHSIKIDKNSKLFDILKIDEIMVNSFHNYKVANEGSYKAVGFSKDVIEAVEKKENLFNIGLQWHPEKNYDKDLNSKKIFEAFIKSSILNYHE